MYHLTYINATADGNYQKVVFGIAGGGLSREALSTVTIPSTSWTHVVGTYDGETVKLYVNGALNSSTSYTGSIQTNDNPVRIGHYQAGNAYFDGKIDEVMILDTALTPQQIAAMYNTEIASNPFLEMLFEANGGNEATSTLDTSVNNNTCTVSGATWNSTGGVDGTGAYSFS